VADDRTPEQQASNTAFEAAFAEVMRAYRYDHCELPGGETVPMVLNEYVLLYHSTGFNAEGDRITSYNWHMGPGEGVPWMHVLGLMKVCGLRMEHSIKEEDQDIG
jgi:hypothetical protein